MRIKLARTAGFCRGVRRAMDLALKLASVKGEKIYTYGPLIHNHQAVRFLEKKGIKVFHRLKRLKRTRPVNVLIRAHGIPPYTQKKLQTYGYKIIDATCPHVQSSEKQVAQYAQQDHQIIIVGDKKHAEVISLLGYASTVNPKLRPYTVSSAEEAYHLKLPRKVPVCLVAQSTFQEAKYRQIVKVFRKRVKRLTVLNTICQATIKRQREVIELANKVEAMIVVGAHHSANTTRLAVLARATRIPTFHIANHTELPLSKLRKYQTIGITAGTSTPDWVTRAVIQKIEGNRGKGKRQE